MTKETILDRAEYLGREVGERVKLRYLTDVAKIRDLLRVAVNTKDWSLVERALEEIG